jgi:hypothetical protein
MTERAVVGEIKLPSTGFWRLLFKLDEVTLPPAEPLHCDAPVLRHAEIAAVCSGQRVAGDFYEFLRVGPSRMLFVLLDIAGLRADTREILTAVQKTFRTLAPELLSGEDFNETTAMIELCNEMNLNHFARRTSQLSGVHRLLQGRPGDGVLCQCGPHAGAAS